MQVQQQAHHQCCSTCRFPPLRPASPHVVRPITSRSSRRVIPADVKVQAWTQVIDQASGKPYYWNTDTNETAWEIPSPAAAAAAAAATVAEPSASASATSSSASASTPQEQQQQGADSTPTSTSMSNDALFDVLAAAYRADGSGMEFWEVARAHRQYGVFEPPYFEYLEQRQKAAGDDAEQRDLAFKMMCRLANPLLRQPAPFE